MKKIALLSFVLLLAAGCSFIAPYNITFTTTDDTIVNPDSDTLDLVLNNPALAYVSGYKCNDADEVELLPVVKEGMEPTRVYNMSLSFLADQPVGSHCKVTVTAFDRTTTTTETNDVWLFMRDRLLPEPPAEEPAPAPAAEDHSTAIAACQDTGGTWNECGSACEEGDELCIQVCVPKCEFPNVQPEATGDSTETLEPTS